MGRVRVAGATLWRWLGHASIAHFLWSIGLGAVGTTLIRAVTDLPWPWLVAMGVGLALLVFAGLLTWGPLAYRPKVVPLQQQEGPAPGGRNADGEVGGGTEVEAEPLNVRIDAMTQNGIRVGHFRGKYWIVRLRQIAVNNRSDDPIQLEFELRRGASWAMTNQPYFEILTEPAPELAGYLENPKVFEHGLRIGDLAFIALESEMPDRPEADNAHLCFRDLMRGDAEFRCFRIPGYYDSDED